MVLLSGEETRLDDFIKSLSFFFKSRSSFSNIAFLSKYVSSESQKYNIELESKYAVILLFSNIDKIRNKPDEGKDL